MFKFPYTNLHELNLDWILEKVKKFSELIPPMETAVEDVQGLQTDVEQAVEDANQAVQDAQSALETAEEAKEIAEQAAQGTIADGAVTTAKLADGAVTSAKIADGSISGNDIAPGTIQTGNLSQGCVTTVQILDGTITDDDLGTGCVTADKLNTSAVTTVKINDGAVTTDKLDAGAVTNAKIADSAVSYVKLDSTAKNDSGSNYCKMPDGTMIQWGTYSSSGVSATQTGSLYMVTLHPDITYPFPFYQDAPKVFLNQYGGYGSIWSCAFNISGIQSIDMARPTSGTITPDISWLAIGRWK